MATQTESSTHLASATSRSLRVRELTQVSRIPSEEFTKPQMEKILRIAYRITRNHEDAEDALQDACLNAITHFQSFDGRSQFSTWFTRIAMNTSLMIVRKRRNAKTVSLDNGANSESNCLPELKDAAPGIEKCYLQKEREDAVREAITRLPRTLRGAIEIAKLRESSLDETAETMGLSLAAVKGRLFHARRTLLRSKRLRALTTNQRPRFAARARSL
jgi:RNA polymerase sigma-70 factor, ECF subfamily